MDFCDTKCCYGPEKCKSPGKFPLNFSSYHKICSNHLETISNSPFITCGHCSSVLPITNFNNQPQRPSCSKCLKVVIEVYAAEESGKLCRDCYNEKYYKGKFCEKCKNFIEPLYETGCKKVLCETCFYTCCEFFCYNCRNHFQTPIKKLCPNCDPSCCRKCFNQTDGRLGFTECGLKSVCKECAKECCDYMCRKCFTHYYEPGKIYGTECKKKVCATCYYKCCDLLCSKCYKHSNIPLVNTECKLKVCKMCEKSCCDAICQNCSKHLQKGFQITDCNKKLCNQCKPKCCEKLCNFCNSHSKTPLNQSSCNKRLCESCLLHCCENLCKLCKNHSKTPLKQSSCNKRLCESCHKNCCEKLCKKCFKHSTTPLTPSIEGNICKDCLIKKCNVCGIQIRHQFKNSDCGKILCSRCYGNCCQDVCTQCFIHCVETLKVMENQQRFCKDCLKKPIHGQCSACSLVKSCTYTECFKFLCEECRYSCCGSLCMSCKQHSSQITTEGCKHNRCYECSKYECLDCLRICPNCNERGSSIFRLSCSHFACDRCQDICRECNRLSIVCIHCDITPTKVDFPCDQNYCKNCYFCEKKRKCIHCGNEPDLKLFCSHFTCLRCRNIECPKCPETNQTKCSSCQNKSKLFKHKIPSKYKEISCFHGMCIDCINQNKECKVCITKSSKPMKYISKECSSCNKIKQINSNNQDCDHPNCNECQNLCQPCRKICTVCNYDINMRYFYCKNNHKLCKNCSNKKCYLCECDEISIGNCLNCKELTRTGKKINNNEVICLSCGVQIGEKSDTSSCFSGKYEASHHLSK